MENKANAIEIPPMIPLKKLARERWSIMGVAGPHKDMCFPCNRRLVMGRSVMSCNVVFPENTPGISKTHCEIQPTEGGLLVRDLDSTYGSFRKDGKRIGSKEPVLLKRGDLFFLANTDIMFRVN